MQLTVFQHVSFEGPGLIARWAEDRGHGLTVCRVDEQAVPLIDPGSMLVVMGGPMSVNATQDVPWLTAECDAVRQAIAAGCPVLGVCLGAQLIARALGAEVTPNPEKEIGWWPVVRRSEVGRQRSEVGSQRPEVGSQRPEVGSQKSEGWASLGPESLTPLHWHGETFGLPDGAVALYQSEACANQAFLFGDRVLGLQFHLEAEADNVENLIENCSDELTAGRWIQSANELRAGLRHARACREVLFAMLDRLADTATS